MNRHGKTSRAWELLISAGLFGRVGKSNGPTSVVLGKANTTRGAAEKRGEKKIGRVGISPRGERSGNIALCGGDGDEGADKIHSGGTG